MKRIRPTPTNGTDRDPTPKTVAKEEVDIFSDPLEQNSIKASYEQEYNPTATISENGPISFSVPKNEKWFTDMSQCYLEMDVQVLKANGQSLTEDDVEKIQPCNLFFDALFSRINLYLNSNKIGTDVSFHPQVSLIKYLLSYNTDFTTDILGNSLLFYKDYQYPGTTAQLRHKYIAGSKVVKLIGRLTDNFFTAQRLLPPNIAIDIALERTNPEFSLVRTKNLSQNVKMKDKDGRDIEKTVMVPVMDRYKIKIHECKLLMRRVEVMEPTYNRLEARLARGAIGKYEFVKTDARSFQMPLGTSSWKANNLFSGKLPARILFGVCEPEGLSSGNYENNPMAFPAAHYKVSHVQFFANEKPLLSRPYEPDFENSQYNRSYMGLIKTARVIQDGRMFGISYKDFGQCYGLFGADLTADASNLSETGTGTLGVEVRFKAPLPHALSGLLIGEFRSCVSIDAFNNITQHDL